MKKLLVILGILAFVFSVSCDQSPPEEPATEPAIEEEVTPPADTTKVEAEEAEAAEEAVQE